MNEYQKSNFSFTFPFDSRLSENKRLIFCRGRFHSQKAYRDLKSQMVIVAAFSLARAKAKFKKSRVNVHIFVYRPDMRSDCQNYIKPIFDAVSEAIGIDDRWFGGSLDWSINKANPRFSIEVVQ